MPFVTRKEAQEAGDFVRVYHPKTLHGPLVKWMRVHCQGKVTSRGQGCKLFQDKKDVVLLRLMFGADVRVRESDLS
jgi:hypothetical protein